MSNDQKTYNMINDKKRENKKSRNQAGKPCVGTREWKKVKP